MLPRLLRRLFHPGARRKGPFVNPLNHFDEAKIIGDIALREAGILHQVPCMVHVLGAALYRLRDADLLLANRMSLNVALVRQWAVENLPLTSPSHRRYEGSLDFEYTFDVYEFGSSYHMRVMPVARPIRSIPVSEAATDKTSRQSKGVVVVREASEDDPFTVGVMSVLRFVGGNQSREEPPEPTIVTLQRVLTELMNDERVLACLADHGVSPETLLAELGQPSA